ncbi:inositol monophosphatase family protein [Sorangium sp. So ce693]|uniref:inositol monophosphatase family protein n=1 Tax=Sorangium sp. So ce693 TaxID=3133318 RepID=UPI003F639507
MPIPDLARVGAFLEEVASEHMLPFWRRLAPGDVTSKATVADPGDVVTTVDLAVERRLTEGLRALLPGSAMVGEEAAHADPRVLDALGGDGWIWLVDPLDGTRNFVEGNDRFGIMVTLVRAARARAAWIHLPARGQTFFAEEGAGAFLNGARLRADPAASAEELAGTIYARYMPSEVRATVEARARGRLPVTNDAGDASNAGSACVDYTSVARGEKDFYVYYRVLPWDHAPGSQILREVNGVVEHLDGTSYAVTSESRVTIVARTRDIAERVRRVLCAGGDGQDGSCPSGGEGLPGVSVLKEKR